MSKNRHRFSLPQRAPLVAAQNAPLSALAPKLGVGAAAAAKQAQPAAPMLGHAIAHYYNAQGELIAAPVAGKAAQ